MRNVREGGVLPGVAGGINTPWAGRGKLAAAKRGSVIAGSIIGEIMDTQVADVRQDNSTGRAAWICLAIAWVTFLVPFPGLGLFIGWPLNLVAFILAIVAMAKSGAGAGLWQLLASLIASPLVYFIGLAVFVGLMGAAGQV